MQNSLKQNNYRSVKVPNKNMVITLFLNLIITLTEVIGGIISGSLSLISDALHNLSDAFSIGISLIAIKLARRENTYRNTFGYKRAEILAATLNSSILIVIFFFIFRAAYLRIIHPPAIKSGWMIGIATVGLVANTLSVLLLFKDSRESLNIKSVYLHLLGDALSSIGVILGGIFIYSFNLNILDPILGIVIGIYILIEGFKILKKATLILIESAPEDIDYNLLKKEVETVDGVRNIHHIHIWSLTEKDVHFEAHLNVEDSEQDVECFKRDT